MNKNKIKLIIFDLWQTIADIPLKPIGEIYNICRPGIPLKKFINDIRGSDVFISDLDIEDTLSSFLSMYPEAVNFDNCILRWKEITTESYIIENSLEVLKELSKRYKLALCSDTDKYGFENFAFKEILIYFDSFFISYQKGVRKSNLELWRLISDHYPNLKPENILVVGDSENEDIKPAKKLHFKSFKVDYSRNLADLLVYLGKE
jgi:hypothetical protein